MICRVMDDSDEFGQAFDFCSQLNVPGTFIPAHLSMFINRTQDVALWESVYVHETAHSLVTDTMNGWWIQLLEDIGNNMFVVFRRGDLIDERIVSWILNLEFKRRKLVDMWMQTQEGFATYSQLDVVDVKRRAIGVATELYKISHRNITEGEINHISKRVDDIRVEWLRRISSRNCPRSFWRGYELFERIARKFGKNNLAPAVVTACSVRYPDSFIAQDIDEFQKTISQDRYNVDKRLEMISQIPDKIVKNFPLVDDWTGLAQEILKHLDEEPLEEEFDLGKMTMDNYLNPAFPNDFLKIAKKETQSQLEKSRKRWKSLETKGVDSSQLVSLFNIEGEATIISDFDLVHSIETDEVLAMIYRSIFNGLDRIGFINDLLTSLRKRGTTRDWMRELEGFGDLARLRYMFPLNSLLSLEEACSLCHSRLKYSNPGLLCPHSNMRVCFNCCVDIGCSGCQSFKAKHKILPDIAKTIESFSYAL